ncbi:MAG: end-binding protein Ku [Blastocatellia bacterium]|jgi:DNA end-binding protein Ku|nr:end-binding protein Ku [Blastocatellia bacterium]
MAARAIWKGELRVDSTKVPVKLYAAVKDQTVHFHILEGRSKKRVKQHMIDPGSGKEVAAEEIQKGFEVEPGSFVILDEKEIESLEPKTDRQIEIRHFVPPKEIAPEFYDRPYYLGPDGDAAAYFAFAEALRNQEREGIVRWVMRKQPYVGALRAEGDYLLLFTLRSPEEVLSAKDLPRPAGRAPDKKELSMAKQLVEMLKGEFDPKDYQDEYRQRVLEFVEKKAKGRAPRLRLVKNKRQPASLDKILSKSIESLKKQKRAA